MSVTVWGAIADETGHSQWVSERAYSLPNGRTVVQVENIYGTLRVDQFRHSQPPHVPMEYGSHDAGECGQVVYLEEQGRHLVAVAVLDHLQPDDLDAAGPLKFSTRTRHPRSGDNVELVSIAVVKAADAATVALPCVQYIDGDVRYEALSRIGIGQQPAILKRARDYNLDRRRSQPIMIRRADNPLSRIEYMESERFGKRLALVDGEPIGLLDAPHLHPRRFDDDPVPVGYGPMEHRLGKVTAVH